jgi:hypothetical protein
MSDNTVEGLMAKIRTCADLYASGFPDEAGVLLKEIRTALESLAAQAPGSTPGVDAAKPLLVVDITPEEIDDMRSKRGQGMVSSVGEYTPDELWTALDEIERLRGILAAGGGDSHG